MNVKAYRGLIDHITSRITSGNVRFLSYTDRLLLIKSVLMATHSYWAQICLMPISVIDEIERRCRIFLWSGCAMNSHQALVAWSEVCKKEEGGLGVLQLSW